jgi:hypothetical protein
MIHHAITRYEHASKELPGAPRDTLLKAVTLSNLNTALTPIPEAPKPRKRPACLVKGIRANMVAVFLPPGAKTPSSIPAVIADVNVLLKGKKLDGRVKEIHYGVHRHITIVFDKTVEDATSQEALNTVLGKFNTARESTYILEQPTFSILKFTAVPVVTNDGHTVTNSLAGSFLRRHPDWKDAEWVEEPRFIFPKTKSDSPSLCATLQIKVKDTLKATMAKKLLATLVTFAGVTRRCQPWTVAHTTIGQLKKLQMQRVK